MRNQMKPERAALSASGKANILVVDDHPDKLLVLQTVLEDLDENVVTATSGKEALRLMLEIEFAVILLDVKMPEMDGFETATLIRGRRQFAHTPIIFVTAYADEMQTSEGYSLGAVDYILTPIQPEILRSKVGVFVQLFHMTRKIRQQADERVALAREQTARAAAEEAIQRSNFLAEASQVLGNSFAVEDTLKGLIQFSVPYLGDLCCIVQLEEGRIHKTQLAWTAGRGSGPVNVQNATVVRLNDEKIEEALTASLSGSDVTIVELENGRITLSADDGGPAPLLLPLGFALGKLAVFPLVARGRKLGALIIGVSTARSFSSPHLAIAADVAGRTAIALDNALLYSRIQTADQRKDEFLAMLAHELRNPLAPIRSAVAVMRQVGGQAPLMTWSRDVIDRQVEHLTRLVDDLLDVSRLTQGKIHLEMQPVELASVMERAIEVSRSAIDSHKHRLNVVLPPVPVYLNGDSVRLSQIFSNLLNNAAKYTPEEGRIDVGTEVADGHVLVCIKDNGCGIPADTLPLVFDLFIQANRSLARSEGGLGVGLTLVRNLVEKHGGSVEARSDGPGLGSEFIVKLPLLQGLPVPLQARPGPQPVAGPSGLRILLIDDNNDANEALATLLGLTGHFVRTALDGPTALQIAVEFSPQLVFCDLGLPGMDGYEVQRRLRGQSTAIMPVIFALTGYGRAEDYEQTRVAGFDGHLVKPVDPVALDELIAVQMRKVALT